MSEPLDRIKAALPDRYAIEREIGSGGMATVYLAEDLKHHRYHLGQISFPRRQLGLPAMTYERPARSAG